MYIRKEKILKKLNKVLSNTTETDFKEESMEKIYSVVGYVRVDPIESSGDNTAENQNNKINDFITRRNDLKLVKIYSDCGVSGLTFDRAGLNELLNEVRTNNVDCVIVYNLSRIGRDVIGVSKFIHDNFTKKEIKLISIKDNVDETEPLSFFKQILENTLLLK